MIVTIALLYVICAVFTWVYAGYLTGRQFARIARANPTMPIQINWINVFFQGLVWMSFWASFIGDNVEKRNQPQTTGPDIRKINREMLKVDDGVPQK